MTPKEKAEELFKKFIEYTQEWDELDGYVVDKYNAKQCALIAVDELIKSTPTFDNKDFFDEGCSEWWQEVKQEINKL